MDGSDCTINDNTIKNKASIVQYFGNIDRSLLGYKGSPYDTFCADTGIATVVYIPYSGFKFKIPSGITIQYSSTINGTYSTVGSVANNEYTTTKAGYYKFQGVSQPVGVTNTKVSMFPSIVEDLPKVTILSETWQGGSTSHAGNKIILTYGETTFKPTITCNMTYDCGASLTLSRSTAQNGTYTQLSSYSPGSGGKHTSGTYNSLTSSYYYKLNGANSYVYLKDTAGSAVQFVK